MHAFNNKQENISLCIDLNGQTENQDFKNIEEKLFSYIIVRGDLDMPAGKLAAQATHVARISLLKYIAQHPEHLEEFISLGSCGSVVVLQAKNLSQLEDCHVKALSENLPTALFTDSEHILLPHFDGSPVVTALSIGPASRQTMRHLTKKFRCVQ